MAIPPGSVPVSQAEAELKSLQGNEAELPASLPVIKTLMWMMRLGFRV